MASSLPSFRTLTISLGFSGLALITGMTGCDSKPKTIRSASPEVLVTPVVQQDVPILREWLGTTDGSANADIRARVSGYVEEQFYTNGMPVKKGEPLFQIDPRPFMAALQQAKATLAQVEAQQGKAQSEEQRQKQLFDQKAASQKDYETAVQNNLATKAAIEANKAAVRQAELNLEFTKITSPMDGIAGVSSVGAGDLVGGAQSQPLTTVSCVDPIKVIFPISEQEYLKAAEAIVVGAAVPQGERPSNLELILGNSALYPYKGRYSVINRQVDSKTGTITLEALFPNPNNILRPGQFAKVRAIQKMEKGALLVPQRAVIELQGSYQVVVIGADNKASVRSVKTGERFGSMWVISEGLKPGENVVVEGVQKARDGVTVVSKPWGAPANSQTK